MSFPNDSIFLGMSLQKRSMHWFAWDRQRNPNESQRIPTNPNESQRIQRPIRLERPRFERRPSELKAFSHAPRGPAARGRLPRGPLQVQRLGLRHAPEDGGVPPVGLAPSRLRDVSGPAGLRGAVFWVTHLRWRVVFGGSGSHFFGWV